MTDGQGFEVIYLNDLPYYCTGEEYTQLATLLGKVSFGDYTKDSDMLISSKIYSSFSGGGQVYRTAREGGDEGRFWFASNMQTTYPNQLGLGDEVVSVANAGFILGDLGNTFYAYADDDNKLYSIDVTDMSKTEIGAVDDPPVYRGYEFMGKQYIPQGANGYQSHNGTAIDSQVTTVQAICFAEWDNKLFALCADHKIQSTVDGSTWVDRASFNTSATPKRLIKYFNAAEMDTLYFSTNKGLMAWDESTQQVVATRVYGSEAFPPHPDNGDGLAMWKPGEDLFMSVGLDVARWNLNAVSMVQSGLSRDEGLPPEYRGRIADLIPGHRYMYAITEGVSETTPATPSGDEFDVGHIDEGEFSASATEARNLVMGWNGFGWHSIHTPAESGEVRWLQMSQAQGQTRLWWGVDDTAYSVRISRPALNLRSRIAVSEGRFMSSGWIESARFDAGKMMFDKILSHGELYMDYFAGLDTHQFLIEYKTDRHDWLSLSGEPLQEQLVYMPFGVETTYDDLSFARGEVCRWIQFRWRAQTYDPTSTPLMDFFTLKYITRPLSNSTFSLHLPIGGHHLPNPVTGATRGPQDIKEELDALAVYPGFVRLVHNGMSEDQRSHRVYLSRTTGNNMVGLDPDGNRIISLVQIPLPSYEGNEFVQGLG